MVLSDASAVFIVFFGGEEGMGGCGDFFSISGFASKAQIIHNAQAVQDGDGSACKKILRLHRHIVPEAPVPNPRRRPEPFWLWCIYQVKPGRPVG